MLNECCFKFSLECLKKYVTMEPEKNFFLSPQLIYQNLLMVYFGANGDIENSLKQILYIPDIPKDTVKKHYFLKGAIEFCYVFTKPKYINTCRVYSRLFISEFIEMTDEALLYFSTGHGHCVTTTTFGKCDTSRNFINNAVAVVTEGCIQNLLPPESIHKDTDVVLLNAIYCKGEIGHCSGDAQSTTTVFSDSTDDDTELLGSHVVEVPWYGEEISTFFFYPTECEMESIVHFVERLTTEEGSRKLRKLLDKGTGKDSFLLSPRFKIEQDLRMYELLDALGFRKLTPLAVQAQSPQSVQLHELTCESIELGDAMHRISIDISNDNITAAASTAFFTSNSCQHVPTNTVDMDFCRPCVCLIYNKCNQSILFCGVLLEGNTEG